MEGSANVLPTKGEVQYTRKILLQRKFRVDAINFPPTTQTSCKHHHLSNTWIYECSPISTFKQETFWLF